MLLFTFLIRLCRFIWLRLWSWYFILLVSNFNITVSRIYWNLFRCHLTLWSSVATKCWSSIYIPLSTTIYLPFTVCNFASNFIKRYFLSDNQLSTRRRNDCNYSSWSLSQSTQVIIVLTWITWHWTCWNIPWWSFWSNNNGVVFNPYSYSWNAISSCNYCLRNILSWNNLPSCWNLWIYIYCFTGLATKRSLPYFFAITINVRNLPRLSVDSISNSDFTILIIASYFHLFNLVRICGIASKFLRRKSSKCILTIYRSPLAFTIGNQLSSNQVIYGSPHKFNGLFLLIFWNLS